MSISDFHRRFMEWFRSMPTKWKVGLWRACAGETFRGDLLDKDGRPIVVVFFVPAEIASEVEASIIAADIQEKAGAH